MNKHRIGYSVVVGALLLAPQILTAREPKLADPCKEMKANLDNQVNDLHKRQDEELDQCRKTNGKNSDVCRDLKNQQKLELNQARDNRENELNRCTPHLANTSHVQQRDNRSCDQYAQNPNDNYSHDKHHE